MHTPGPWKITRYKDFYDVFSPAGNRVATVAFSDQSLDDARLIAAAPELLAACKAAVKTTDVSAQKEALDYLYAVIEKAEGR